MLLEEAAVQAQRRPWGEMGQKQGNIKKAIEVDVVLKTDLKGERL